MDERLPVARQRAEALAKRLPHLTIRYAGTAPPGIQVRRGDLELGEASLGSALPVDPGKYIVTTSAPGYATTTAAITLVEGASSVLEVRVGSPGRDTAPPPRAGSHTTAGWVLTSIGVAGLATAGIAGTLTLGRKSTVDDNC